MTWSTAQPRRAEPVLGDPASLSSLAATLLRISRDLDDAVAAVTDPLTPSLTGEGIPTRRYAGRLRALRERGRAVSASLDQTGQRLADHAVVLADAHGLARRIAERAESHGLTVDGTRVVRPAGVQGLADADAEAARAEVLARLQRVLDAVLLDLDARRAELRAAVTMERDRRASR